jgi:hypothetical protein
MCPIFKTCDFLRSLHPSFHTKDALTKKHGWGVFYRHLIIMLSPASSCKRRKEKEKEKYPQTTRQRVQRGGKCNG